MGNCELVGKGLVSFLLCGAGEQSLRRRLVAVVHARRPAGGGRAAALRGDRLRQSLVIRGIRLIFDELASSSTSGVWHEQR